MPPRLRHYPMPRIDQDNRELTRTRPSCHIPRVLLMARRVGNDEFSLVRREVSIGDIDGNPLLPLGLKAIRQQRQIDAPRFARGAKLHRIPLHGGELVFVNPFRIVQQATDQRGLPVIDRAAAKEA